MKLQTFSLVLPTPEDTDHLGQVLARHAHAGDCILLRGQIGAGKSALARAFIRERLGIDTEVPSPTFTLVQTYEDDTVEIWHADLYRLSDTQEAVELGLMDAFDAHICLIEWPELLEGMTPKSALHVEITVHDDHHLATITFGPDWQNRVAELQPHA